METMPSNGYYGSEPWSPGYPNPEYVCGYEIPPSHGTYSLPVLSSLSGTPPGVYHKSTPQSWYSCNTDELAQLSHGSVRRDTYYGHPYHPEHHRYHHSQSVHPTTIARRNERERNRVKNINSTFGKLRQHLPCSSKNKKLSKVQILRSAIQYISQLQHILDSQEEEEKACTKKNFDFAKAFDSQEDTSKSSSSPVFGQSSSDRCASGYGESSPTSLESSSASSSPSSVLEFEEGDGSLIGELADWMQ